MVFLTDLLDATRTSKDAATLSAIRMTLSLDSSLEVVTMNELFVQLAIEIITGCANSCIHLMYLNQLICIHLMFISHKNAGAHFFMYYICLSFQCA
jgi:hypothetical protein